MMSVSGLSTEAVPAGNLPLRLISLAQKRALDYLKKKASNIPLRTIGEGLTQVVACAACYAVLKLAGLL